MSRPLLFQTSHPILTTIPSVPALNRGQADFIGTLNPKGFSATALICPCHQSWRTRPDNCAPEATPLGLGKPWRSLPKILGATTRPSPVRFATPCW